MAEITVFYQGPVVTRREAIAGGLRRFFTAKPCKRGHIAERVLPSGNCVECDAAYRAKPEVRQRDIARGRKRYWSDPVAARAASMRRYGDHRDARIAGMRRYHQANRPAIAARNRNWKAENPERLKALQSSGKAADRGRRLGIGGGISADDIEGLFARQRGRCTICGNPLSRTDYHIDHHVPLSRGGKNEKSNIEIVHGECNMLKGRKDPIVFAQERGRLL